MKQIKGAAYWTSLDLTQELLHKFQTLHDWCKIKSIILENPSNVTSKGKDFNITVTTIENGYSLSDLMIATNTFNEVSGWKFLCVEPGQFKVRINDAALNNAVDTLLIDKGYSVS